jgi:hypothetical protein
MLHRIAGIARSIALLALPSLLNTAASHCKQSSRILMPWYL